MKVRPFVVLPLAMAGLLAAIGFFAWRSDSRAVPGREPAARVKASPRTPALPRTARSRRPAPAPKEKTAAGPVEEILAALGRALEAGDRAGVLGQARALRAALLKDPSLVEVVAASLVDSGAPPAVRQVLAVVLGSHPDPAGKRSILEALQSGALEGIERTALLSLGIEEVEDSEVFERDSQPYAAEVAPGLIVFVRGPLADPEARAEAAAWLADEASPDERLAAARVLHDSTGFPDVRKALLERIGEEPEAEVTAEAAAALAEWTRGAAPGEAERGAVLARLFDAVPASQEVVRFRLTGPLSSTPLGPEEENRLASLAEAPEGDARRFAVDVLGRKLDPRHPEGDPRLATLTHAALADPSPDVREAAVVSLGRAARVPQVAETLVGLLSQDVDWEVRAAAARSLGRAGSGEAVRTALMSALQSDPEPLVRSAADEALSALQAEGAEGAGGKE